MSRSCSSFANPATVAVKAGPLPALLVLALLSGTSVPSAEAFYLPLQLSKSPFFNKALTSHITAASHRQAIWDLTPRGVSHSRLGSANWVSALEKEPDVGTTVFTLAGTLSHPLKIEDPKVSDTEDAVLLIFKLPTDVKQDGLDISVSGRILTVEARVTREDKSTEFEGERASRSPRAQYSSSTHSCARSFVLPARVSSHHVTASWISNDTFQVKLDKVHLDDAGPHSGPSQHVASTTDDSGGIPVDRREDRSIPSSAADDYLSRLKTVATGTGKTAGSNNNAAATTSSVLSELDEDFRKFAKELFWESRFPTEEQVAETVAQAREERAQRLNSIMRATMATKVTEKERSYIVRFALPHGSTRDNIKLAVTPEDALRVTFVADSGRSISKYVHLPLDAVTSDVSAEFIVDDTNRSDSGTAAAGGVTGLEVTIGRETPPQPKTIRIL